MTVESDLAEARQDVGAPGLIRDHDVPAVADDLRGDVLVGARILFHRRDMQAALVGEGVVAHVGGVGDGVAVEPLVQHARDMGELREPVGADADVVIGFEH